jgi:hypothetical protein
MGWKPGGHYPLPPIFGGAPVSPAAMTRDVVVKAAREEKTTDGRAALVIAVRSILGGGRGSYGIGKVEE